MVTHTAAVCPPPLRLVIERADLDGDRCERALEALAVTADGGAAAQLRALGAPVRRGRLRARTGGELRLERVLEGAPGDPLAVAIALQELGRRAGLPVAIVAGAAGHFAAHQHLTQPRLLCPLSGALVDADALGVLHWRCAHQLAAELLERLQARYERSGRPHARAGRRPHAGQRPRRHGAPELGLARPAGRDARRLVGHLRVDRRPRRVEQAVRACRARASPAAARATAALSSIPPTGRRRAPRAPGTVAIVSSSGSIVVELLPAQRRRHLRADSRARTDQAPKTVLCGAFWL